jgi:cytochrome c oxidase subunit IV
MERARAQRVYFWTFGALLGLLALTWGFAYINLGAWNAPIALTIAAAKALLIALFFMHLRGSRNLLYLAAASGIIWLIILLGFVLSDYITRTFEG